MRKEWKVLRRDRFYLLIAVVMPTVTMILMGYGISYDVKNLRLGVLDLDRSAESLQFVDAFTTSGYFRLALQALRPDDLDQAMVAGQIRVAVVIPPGFSRALHGSRPAEAQILLDGSLPTRAEIARGYVSAIVAQFNQGHLEMQALRLPPGASGAGSSVDVLNRVWFNPTLESKNFLVPGLLMLSLLFWAPALVSLSVTREKESGAILNVQTVPLGSTVHRSARSGTGHSRPAWAWSSPSTCSPPSAVTSTSAGSSPPPHRPARSRRPRRLG